MRNPLEDMKKQEGYQEYQDAAARTPKKQYPWGTLLANTAGIAGAHALGYATAGTIAEQIAKSRLGAQFLRLHPTTQRLAIAQTIGVAGSIGAVAAGMAHLAGQMRVADKVSRLESENTKPGEKVAAVRDAYRIAALRMGG